MNCLSNTTLALKFSMMCKTRNTVDVCTLKCEHGSVNGKYILRANIYV